MQRMNRNRIKLLVTLVLFSLVATSTWTTSQADARGHKSPGASSDFSVTRPGAASVAGDPDSGSGVTPPVPPSLKQTRQVDGGEDSGRNSPAGWIRWTGRIWALYLKTRL